MAGEEGDVPQQQAEAVEIEEVGVEEGGEQQQQQQQKKKKQQRKKPLAELKHVDPPDEEAFELNQETAASTVVALKAKIDGNAKRFETLLKERNAARDQKRQVVGKLKAIKKQKDALYTELNGFSETINKVDDDRKAKRDRVAALRKDLVYFSVEEIDANIERIEHRIANSSLTLKQEKDALAEIKRLRASKAGVVEYAKAKKALDGEKFDTKAARQQRDAKRAELRAIRDTEAQHQATYRELKAQESKASGELDRLTAERREAMAERKRVQSEAARERTAHMKHRRAYERYYEQVKYLKRVEARRQRMEREKEYKARREAEEETKEKRHPYETELFLCEELSRYLRRLAPQAGDEGDKNGEDEAKQGGAGREAGSGFAEKAAVPLKKTKKGQEMFGGAPAAKKKRVRRRAQKSTKLVHIPDVFAQFERLGLVAPLDVSAVPETLKQLAEKAKYFETAPPPLTQKEKAEIKKREAKEKQEKAALKRERLKEAKERTAAHESVKEAVAEEQARRVAEAEQGSGAVSEEREKSARAAVAAEEEEQARRVAEADEAARENEAARQASRRRSMDMQDAEQLRRVEEAVKAAEENKAEAAAAAKAADAAEEEEQARRVAEAEAERKAGEEAAEAERKAAAAEADRLAEEERKRREAERTDVVDPATLGKARRSGSITVLDAEMARAAAEHDAEVKEVAAEESKERERRRSIAADAAEEERMRRVAEAAAAQEEADKEAAKEQERVDAEVEEERKRQIKEFPETIQKTSVIVEVEKPPLAE